MQYTKLGSTGLDVSRLCLGCMSFGADGSGPNSGWTLNLDAARPIVRAALDAGINFYDTANMYGSGTSEEIIGTLLREAGRREELVIATKVFHRTHPGPNGAGLSRKAIMTEIDASLRRLGTDYVDLYQIHRWDEHTPIEETLEALHDVVKAGKARYIGASSMAAWQFAKALHLSKRNGWTRFVSMQNQYSLLYREEEREMIPLCLDEGIGVIPYSPLARGRLARPEGVTTLRTQHGRQPKVAMPENDTEIIDNVGKVAEQRGARRSQIALAWLLHQPAVTAPIIGVTKPHHLEDALGALDVTLTVDELAQLEDSYRPRPPADLMGRRAERN